MTYSITEVLFLFFCAVSRTEKCKITPKACQSVLFWINPAVNDAWHFLLAGHQPPNQTGLS